MREINTEELKRIQIDIILHIDAFCKKHNIRYFICGGTLIGAVRHKGFIPWDDDIDIMMLRADYERFIKLYSSMDDSIYHVYHHTLDEKYPYPYAKIDNSHTVFSEEIKESFALGVNIDLFPIDIVPENSRLQKRMYEKVNLYMKLMTLKRLPTERRRGVLKNTILSIAHLLLRPISFRRLICELDKNARQYVNMESSLCGVAVWGYGVREINELSNYSKALYVPFEDILLPIPVGYDKYLRGLYGNYMQLPPEDKQVSHHHFKAYWKQ
ncbi:MAG: LicD family protein [Lachnospiraceae bacterium]|nr:LicD family protein [Lachnospiraceae bacterium]